MLGSREEAVGIDRRRATIGTFAVPRQAVLGAVIVAEVLLLYLLLNGGSWVYDDNLILILAGRSGLTWSWLTSPIFQHWGIGYHLVFSVLHKLMPIDYRWALAGMLALLAGSMYLIDRICALLFRGRWLGLVVASYLGLSVLFIRHLQWLADGLQAIPTTFFDLLCLYGYLRYVRDGSRRWVFVSAGALAVGLTFYEKPAYMLGYLLLLRLLFTSEDLGPRRFARALWHERLLWAALGAVTAVWAIGYVHYAGSSALGHGSISAGQYLRFFRVMWAQTLAPALAGFTLPQTGLSAAQVAAAVVLQVLIVLGVATSLRRKRDAWRAWILLAIAVVANGFLVARARIPIFGPNVAGDLRYLTDFTWLVPLSVCFAFSRQRALWPRHVDRDVTLAVPTRLRLVAALGSAALLAYFAAGIATTAKLQREWPGGASRAWQGHVQSGLARYQSGGRRVVVADGASPFFMVSPAFSPYNRLSWVLPLYDPRAQVDGILDGPLLTLDPAGGVHRAAIASSFGVGSVSDLLRTRQLAIAGAARVVRQAQDICIAAGSRSATVTRRAIDVPASPGQPYYLATDYSARQAGALPVFVDSGTGFPIWTDRFLQVTRGSGRSILFLASGSPRRLRLSIWPRSTLCISAMDLVTLRAVN